MFNHQEQQGFLTLAYNTDNNASYDYLELAYVQAMSVKLTMPTSRYAVVVDAATKAKIKDKHRQFFDYVIEAPATDWPMSIEPELFWLTPFKETIKLEADLLLTRNIDHWWHALRLRNLVLSTNCKNIEGKIFVDSEYRKFWKDNYLPNVYNGLMYFRYTREALDFFVLARNIFKNWDYLRDHVLKNCREERPSTDAVYSIAAQILDSDLYTIPSLDFFNFVHMKPHVQGWPGSTDWTSFVLAETDLPVIRINNINQYDPVHYHVKNWITDDIIEQYELASRIT